MSLFDSIAGYGAPAPGLPGAGYGWLGMPQQAAAAPTPFSYGGAVPAGVTPAAAPATGIMGFLRGQEGVAGDGALGWLGNSQNLASVADIGGSLLGAFMGWKQLQHAKDQLGFQKEAWNTNLTNSIQSYNTSLEDRIRGRTADYAGKESDVQDYLKSNRLTRSKP